jgi:hypothetical protein
MSETVKLIVEILKEDYEAVRKASSMIAPRKSDNPINACYNAVVNGTPLDECKAEDCRSLKDIKELLERKAKALDGVPIKDGGGACIGIYFSIANDLPPVIPKSDKSSGEWIRVKDPVNELPIDKPIWVTSRGGRFSGVDHLCYTKSALDKLRVEDVIAYMDYVIPEPYQWWNKEQTDGNDN